MTYKNEFSHYDDTLDLPKGWIDTSWHNDVCPSFEKVFGDTTFRLWCDFKDPALREVGGLRFTVCKYDSNADEFECIGQFESMDEALALIDEVTA
jgi:hypothetical protein